MVTNSTAWWMRCYNRSWTHFQRIIKRFFRSMRKIHHHSYPIHLSHHTFPEITQSIMLRFTAGRIANVVIPIMTQSHIYDSHIPETRQIRNIFSDSISIFNPQENSLLPSLFQLNKIFSWKCLSDPILMYGNLAFQFIQYSISLSGSSFKSNIIPFLLRQISHHTFRIDLPVPHLRQIDLQACIPDPYIYLIREKHRSITMRI